MKRGIVWGLAMLLGSVNGVMGESEVVPLWPGGAPMAKGNEPDDTPTLTIKRPRAESAVGAAVVVCPGGGYRHLAMDHEGVQIADWLNERGIHAYILQYRHAPGYGHPVPLLDAQRAIRMVRAAADKEKFAAEKVGIWGFSAGGHLASTASTHFDAGSAQADDPIDRVSSRPDFSILCYPVISLAESFTHGGSKTNLLGADPDPKLVELLSNERQVTKETPPTFLFQTGEDKAVPAENALAYYAALRRAGIPAELHIYQNGPHGVGLAQKDPVLSTWPLRLEDWLRVQGILPKK